MATCVGLEGGVRKGESSEVTGMLKCGDDFTSEHMLDLAQLYTVSMCGLLHVRHIAVKVLRGRRQLTLEQQGGQGSRPPAQLKIRLQCQSAPHIFRSPTQIKGYGT